jgi:hypothetical protein
MRLTLVGEDAQIRIPKTGKKEIKVLIPAELTKNGAEIEFPPNTTRIATTRRVFARPCGGPIMAASRRPAGFGAATLRSCRGLLNRNSLWP